MAATKSMYVYTMNDEDGQSILADNEKQARAWVNKEAKKYGDTVTNFEHMGDYYEVEEGDEVA